LQQFDHAGVDPSRRGDAIPELHVDLVLLDSHEGG
jgi:hypothetical protein